MTSSGLARTDVQRGKRPQGPLTPATQNSRCRSSVALAGADEWVMKRRGEREVIVNWTVLCVYDRVECVVRGSCLLCGKRLSVDLSFIEMRDSVHWGLRASF